MAFNPEAAMAALFTRLQQATVFAYSSRRLESWADTPPAECPAFFLASGPMTPEYQQGPLLPPLWRINGTLVLYVRNDADPSAPPGILLNTVIGAVVGLLAMQPGEVPAQGAPFVARPPGQWGTTLGGRCSYCRVAGTITVDEGLIDNGGAAVIPIEMLLSS